MHGRVHILARLVYHGNFNSFGYLLAEEALKRGERVIATARDVSKLSRLARQYPDRIHTLTLDVTNPNEIISMRSKGLQPSAMWTLSSITPAMA